MYYFIFVYLVHTNVRGPSGGLITPYRTFHAPLWNCEKRRKEIIKEMNQSFLCFRPMVSESINNSLFHQLAEQLQQQNLEQFQKQILEHQQKVKESEKELHRLLLYIVSFCSLTNKQPF